MDSYFSCWQENLEDGGADKDLLTFLLTDLRGLKEEFLTGRSMSTPSETAIDTFREYIPAHGRGISRYIRLTKAQSAGTLNLHCIGRAGSTIYLSEDLLADLRSGEYPWDRLRANDYLSDGRILPARVDDGTAVLVELGRVPKFRSGAFWESIETQAKTVKPQLNRGAGFRSLNEVMTLFIRAIDGKTERSNNGVSWDDVEAAFKEINRDLRFDTTYEMFEANAPTTGFCKLSTSPLGHYETWIREGDWAKYLAKHPDRPYPKDDEATKKGLQRAGQKLILSSLKDQKQDDRMNKVMAIENINLNEGLLKVPLSSQRMNIAKGKRGTAESQNKVMGDMSANDIASEHFGWNVADKTDRHNSAEWAHLSAFSNGGLTSGRNAYLTSQMQHNLIVSTSETNSVMLRTERAVQRLFIMESELRKMRKDKVTNVQGELTVHVNRGLKAVSHAPAADLNSVQVTQRVFDNDQWFQLSASLFPHVAYALNYEVRLFGECLLMVGLQELTFSQDFSPFARPFFTKGEAKADDMLLDVLNLQAQKRIKFKKRQVSMLTISSHLAVSHDTRDSIAETHVDTRLPGVDSDEDDEPNDSLSNQDEHVTGHEQVPERKDSVSKMEMFSDARESAGTVDEILDHYKLETRNSLFTAPHPSTIPLNTRSSLATNRTFGVAAYSSKSRDADDAQQSEAQGLTPIKVGGTVLHNPVLVTALPGGKGFSDIPIAIEAVEAPASSPAVLLAPMSADDPKHAKPVLLIPSQFISGLQIASSASAPANIQVRKKEIANFAVQAAASRAKVVEVPVTDMVLSGYVDTFLGVPGLRAKVYSLQSSNPGDLALEIAVPDLSGLGENSPIGVLLPLVQDSVMRQVPLDNIKFTYSESENNPIYSHGLQFEGNLKFEGILSPVGNALDMLLGADKAPRALHIAAHLGNDRIWNAKPSMTVLRLEGSFQNLSFWLPGDVVRFTSVGVEVSSVLTSAIGKDEDRWAFGYSFFGSLELYHFPGCDVPLDLKYRIANAGSFFQISMRLQSEEWNNIFGIEGLTLTDVTFNTSFTTKTMKDSFVLEVSATTRVGNTDLLLTGFYSQAFSFLEAHVGTIGIAELGEMYEQLVGKPMSPEILNHNIQLDNLYLQVSTDGLVLSGAVSFNEHSSAEATLSFSSLGLQISGKIAEIKIPDTDITVKEAELDIFVGFEPTDGDTASSGSRFALKGTVKFNGLTVDVGVTIGQSWMVYGRVEGDMPLCKLCPILKDTFLEDVKLMDAALLASNQDQEDTSGLNVLGYPVLKGVQFCARVEKIDQIDNMAQGERRDARQVQGMILVASYTAGELKLAIRMQNITFDLSDTTKLRNMAMAVKISKKPALEINGDMAISLKNEQPLILNGGFEVGPLSVSGRIKTKTVWKNPLGVSPKVEIRELGAGLEFFLVASALKLEVQGAIAVGDVDGSAAIVIGTSIDKLITIGLNNLRVAELIHFAGYAFDIGTLRNLQCGDFLVFLSASMYFSTGTQIGSQEYPEGISAQGTMVLFGKTASFKASIGLDGVVLKGAVDNFSVGPFEVRSASGAPQASLDLSLLRDRQKFKVDGLVRLWSLELKMLVDIAIQPPIAFSVWVKVDFGRIVTLELLAEARNMTDLSDLSKADLVFIFEIKGDPLSRICEGVLELLDTVQKFGTETFEAVDAGLVRKIADVDSKRQSIRRSLEEKKRQLNEVQKAREALLAEQQKIKDHAEAELEKLKKDLEDAKITNKTAIEDAKSRIELAEREKENALRAKKAEYQEELKKAREEEARLQLQYNELVIRKFTKYGDIEQAVERSLREFNEKDVFATRIEEIVRGYEWELRNGNIFVAAAAFLKLGFMTPQATTARLAADSYRKAWSELDAVLQSAGFRDLSSQISSVVGHVAHATHALEALWREGETGFLRELRSTEERKVEEARRALQKLLDGNTLLTQAILDAQDQLERARGPGLRHVIARADERIRRAKEDSIIAQHEQQVNAQEDQERLVTQDLEVLRKALQWAKEDFSQGAEHMKDIVRSLDRVVFRITRIRVQASARDMSQGKPLTFIVAGVISGEEKTLMIQWSPVDAVSDFYKAVVKQTLSL